MKTSSEQNNEKYLVIIHIQSTFFTQIKPKGNIESVYTSVFVESLMFKKEKAGNKN